MKKIILLVLVLVVVGTVIAWNPNPSYNPFEVIWNAINDLSDRLDNQNNITLEHEISIKSGTETYNAGSHDFCFLTKVAMESDNGALYDRWCRVYRSGGNWFLEAYSVRYVEVKCGIMCVG